MYNGLMNNTDISLGARISIERYYNFLTKHLEIFSMNGSVIDNKNVKYINPEPEKKEEVIKGTEEVVETYTTNEVLDKLYALKKALNGVIITHKDSDMVIDGMSVYEINCSDFGDTNSYISPLIYSINLSIENVHHILPFIVVESDTSYKMMVLPFASKLASYNVDDTIRLFDLDPTLITNIANTLRNDLSQNDKIMSNMIYSIITNRYTFREVEDIAPAIKTLGMDERLTQVYSDDSLHYPDMPIAQISTNNVYEIEKIMVTDSNTYKVIKFSEYQESDEYKAVVIRYPSKFGDVCITEIDLGEEYIALPSNLYKVENKVEFSDDGFEEKNVYVPYSESGVYHGIKYVYGPGYSYGESADGGSKAQDKLIKKLEVENPNTYEKFEELFDSTNSVIKSLKKVGVILNLKKELKPIFKKSTGLIHALSLDNTFVPLITATLELLDSLVASVMSYIKRENTGIEDYDTIIDIIDKESIVLKTIFIERNDLKINSRIEKVIKKYDEYKELIKKRKLKALKIKPTRKAE